MLHRHAKLIIPIAMIVVHLNVNKRLIVYLPLRYPAQNIDPEMKPFLLFVFLQVSSSKTFKSTSLSQLWIKPPFIFRPHPAVKQTVPSFGCDLNFGGRQIGPTLFDPLIFCEWFSKSSRLETPLVVVSHQRSRNKHLENLAFVLIIQISLFKVCLSNSGCIISWVAMISCSSSSSICVHVEPTVIWVFAAVEPSQQCPAVTIVFWLMILPPQSLPFNFKCASHRQLSIFVSCPMDIRWYLLQDKPTGIL